MQTRIPVSPEPEVNQCAISDIVAQWRAKGMKHGRVTIVDDHAHREYLLEGWLVRPDPEPPLPPGMVKDDR